MRTWFNTNADPQRFIIRSDHTSFPQAICLTGWNEKTARSTKLPFPQFCFYSFRVNKKPPGAWHTSSKIHKYIDLPMIWMLPYSPITNQESTGMIPLKDLWFWILLMFWLFPNRLRTCQDQYLQNIHYRHSVHNCAIWAMMTWFYSKCPP